MYNAEIYFISSTIFPEDQRRVTESNLVKEIFRKPFDQEKVNKMLS